MFKLLKILERQLRIGTVIFLSLIFGTLQAQLPCPTEEDLQERLNLDPTFFQLYSQQKSHFESFLKKTDLVRFRERLVVPVVVHVVWNQEDQNISDAQIQSQIAVLNADFRALNCEIPKIPIEFQALVADLEIEFCLATLDPDGQPTNGITRTNSQLPVFDRFSKTIFHADQGGADAWAPIHYLNIWIAPLGGTLGFAVFPGTATDPNEDGIVVDPQYFGTIGLASNAAPFHLGRTATHEIGHYFNLLHTFGDAGENACEQDDGVADTPLQGPPNFGACPQYPQVTCGSSDMYMNFMNFANDACLSMFTPGQKTRVWAAIQLYRPGLLESQACEGRENQVPKFGFSIHPNPSHQFFQLKPESEFFPKGQLRVFDMMGKMVLQKDDFPVAGKVDTNLWQSGVYVVSFLCGKEKWTGKLVKW